MPPARNYQKILMLAETKVLRPTSADGSDTFGGSMLMVWMRKLIETFKRKAPILLLEKVTLALMNLQPLLPFLLSCHLFEGYPYKKILSRHFTLAIKLAKGQSFPLTPYFLGTFYFHLDHFTLDLQHSWDIFQIETFVPVAFL